LLAAALVVLLVTFVIPRFSDFYLQFGSELPLPTRLVLGTAQTVQSNLILIIVGGALAIWGFRTWKASPGGRRLVDRWVLRVPLLGRLAQLFALSQFTRSMAVLLGGGTPMVPSLETAATSVKNVYIAELFLGCVHEVQEGRPLSDALEDTGRAPRLALAMIRVGESTGALPEMLEHTSDFFDEEIEFSLTRITTLFEPMILVVMGVIIAGLLLAVYYPLLRLVSTIA
jgi:type IV pilus assembly protein PilC